MDFSRGHRGVTVTLSKFERSDLEREGLVVGLDPRNREVTVIFDESAQTAVEVHADSLWIITSTIELPVMIEPSVVDCEPNAFIGNKESITLTS